MSSLGKIRVAVLRGGPSSEYDVSLQTGATILKNLSERYKPVDILISKSGDWHEEGIVKPPGKILASVGAVWNALHGEFGEDGKVQDILEAHQVPFTGSGKISSALAMNKLMTKNLLNSHGVLMPRHITVRRGDDFHERSRRAFNEFPPPYVVKPVSLGSSVGVRIAKKVGDIPDFLAEALRLGGQAMIEEFISGREATCGVVNNFRGAPVYSLMPIEIRPKGANNFYDYDAKYVSDETEYLTPGNFSTDEKDEIERVAALAHSVLGLRHYSRADFMVHPKRGVFFLETNSLPGFTPHSLVPKSLVAIGCSIPEFLDHILTETLNGR